MKNKLLSISILFLACIVGFLYWFTLQDQTKLPSKEWSRSYSVNTEVSNFSTLQSVQEENGYTISLLDFKKLIVLSCDKEMTCNENRTHESLNTYKNSWSDKTDSYFIKDDTLVHSNISSGQTVVATNVSNFSKTKNTLVYWTEDQEIIVLNSPFSNEKQRFKINDPVYFVKVLGNDIFIITKKDKEDLYTVYNLTDQLSKLFQFNVSSQEILSSLDIIQLEDNNFSLIQDKKTISGGTSTNKIVTALFNLSFNQEPTYNILSFVEEQSGSPLKDVYSPTFYQGTSGPMITVSSTFLDETGEKVTKVFVGNFSEDTIKVNALTKIPNRYERPIFLDEQTVAYFKMKGSNRFLEYSSSDELKKQESNGIMAGDYKEAGYTLLGKLFNGFILVLFSFVWIIITFIVSYGTVLLLQKLRFAHSFKTAFIVHIITLFSIQTYFIYNFTSIESIIYKIPYISENWHFVILLVISTILSIIPLKILRYKLMEDTFNLFVVYTTFMNLIILFFLVGPYLF
ncbi:hypothetical protein ACFVR1_17835 [Psychrobacillus sp. NPDC058041]|uniref:hypothetical protein n=1 Tax=Psychrobacillus sp. NPDC058041 TaxID=3346310 RepID=UPI0036DA93B6